MNTLKVGTDPFVLLYTKFQRPRLRENLVVRQRLMDQINTGLRPCDSPNSLTIPRKLILVSAPAGYGKTTVLGQWLEECPHPSTWLSLDAGDSNLNVFLTYFTKAIQTVYPSAVQQTSSLLKSHQKPPHEYLASTLINELAELPGKLILVLDDFHRIDGEAVPKLVTTILDRLPPQICLAIITRQDPDLPLIRMRASGEMIELRTADLCFAPDEVHLFLRQSVGSALSDEEVETLDKRTEGWIVGLRLAALALRGAKDPAAFVRAFQASGHRYVMEYLLDEVLSHQSSAIQDFLLRTSILERFCVPLCDAIVDHQQNEAILQELEQANLFLVSLDFEGNWYRYHHLFQELLAHRLHTQLAGEEIAALHNKASAWFAANALIEEAMAHSLAAGDQVTAARLVERNYRKAVNLGQWPRLRRWMAILPESMILQRPGLLIARCWLLHQEFKLAATFPVFESATAILEDPELNPDLSLGEVKRRYLLAEAHGLRSQVLYFFTEFEHGLSFAEQSLAHLSPTFSYGRSGAWFYWGLHSHALGKGEEASSRLQQVILAEPEFSPFTMHLYLSLCYIYRSSADFPRLLQAGRSYLTAAQKAALPESVAFAHYHLGVLHFEWNELETARHHFEAAINLRYFAHQLSYYSSLQGLILLLLAQDQPEDVPDLLAAMNEFAQHTENHLLLASSCSFQARLSMLRGDLDWAERESQAAFDGPQVEPMLLFEIPALTRATVLVNRKTPESLRQAMTLLDELLDHAQTTHFTWRQIEVLALQAMALAVQGHTEAALSRLEEAVALAKPGWLVRTFVDLGPSLADLLRQLARRGVAVDYLSHVLAAFDSGSDATLPTVDLQAGFIEPLTERELEILLLFDERLTNQEIAQQLVISPKTVKRHASNIYQKLSVSNRREAATKAKELGLLPTPSGFRNR